MSERNRNLRNSRYVNGSAAPKVKQAPARRYKTRQEIVEVGRNRTKYKSFSRHKMFMYGITFLGVAACICMMVFSAYFENAKKTELSSLQTQVEAKQEENKNVNDKIMNGINDFEMKSRALRLGMKVVDADNYVEYKAPENNYVKVNNNK